MRHEREGAVWTVRDLASDVNNHIGRRHMLYAIKPALKELQDEKLIGYEGGTVRAYYLLPHARMK